jgi:hypothetical protein
VPGIPEMHMRFRIEHVTDGVLLKSLTFDENILLSG